MARPKKQGLDYFPLDSAFLADVKVRKIMRAQGANAVAVLISLLCNIYKDKGYYMRRDDDVSFLIADEVGIREEYVNEVIDRAIQVGFFDENQFIKNKILTSNGIQKRFFEATERRKDILFEKDFLINAYENKVNVNNNRVNEYKSTQRESERKVKESKGDDEESTKENSSPPTQNLNFSVEIIPIDQAVEKINFENVDFQFWARRDLQKSVEELENLFENFIVYQKGVGKKSWQNIVDLRKHFIDWSKKEIYKKTINHGTKNITAHIASNSEWKSTGKL